MTSAKLLVVDDDRTTAAVLCAQIEMLGFEAPLLAVDNRSALQLAKSEQPDLILMDIQLGAGIDGIDTARTIQEELHIPVIYVTAHADSETLARARDTRPMGFINKPLREIDLRTTLELALSEIAQRKNLPPGSALSNTLNCISTGVMLLDSNLSVSFINQVARDILEEYDDLLLLNGQLACSKHDDTQQLRELVQAGDDGQLLLNSADPSRPLQILVTPLNRNRADSDAIAALFLLDPANKSAYMIETLQRLYQLTQAEARLAAALAQEPRLAQAAEISHIGMSTARTHLKRIFSKTTTSSQSELIHLLVTGPAGLLIRVRNKS